MRFFLKKSEDGAVFLYFFEDLYRLYLKANHLKKVIVRYFEIVFAENTAFFKDILLNACCCAVLLR